MSADPSRASGGGEQQYTTVSYCPIPYEGKLKLLDVMKLKKYTSSLSHFELMDLVSLVSSQHQSAMELTLTKLGIESPFNTTTDESTLLPVGGDTRDEKSTHESRTRGGDAEVVDSKQSKDQEKQNAPLLPPPPPYRPVVEEDEEEPGPSSRRRVPTSSKIVSSTTTTVLPPTTTVVTAPAVVNINKSNYEATTTDAAFWAEKVKETSLQEQQGSSKTEVVSKEKTKRSSAPPAPVVSSSSATGGVRNATSAATDVSAGFDSNGDPAISGGAVSATSTAASSATATNSKKKKGKTVSEAMKRDISGDIICDLEEIRIAVAGQSPLAPSQQPPTAEEIIPIVGELSQRRIYEAPCSFCSSIQFEAADLCKGRQAANMLRAEQAIAAGRPVDPEHLPPENPSAEVLEDYKVAKSTHAFAADPSTHCLLQCPIMRCKVATSLLSGSILVYNSHDWGEKPHSLIIIRGREEGLDHCPPGVPHNVHIGAMGGVQKEMKARTEAEQNRPLNHKERTQIAYAEKAMASLSNQQCIWAKVKLDPSVTVIDVPMEADTLWSTCDHRLCAGSVFCPTDIARVLEKATGHPATKWLLARPEDSAIYPILINQASVDNSTTTSSSIPDNSKQLSSSALEDHAAKQKQQEKQGGGNIAGNATPGCSSEGGESPPSKEKRKKTSSSLIVHADTSVGFFGEEFKQAFDKMNPAFAQAEQEARDALLPLPLRPYFPSCIEAMVEGKTKGRYSVKRHYFVVTAVQTQ